MTSRANTLIYREIVQSGRHIGINKLVFGKYTLQVLKSIDLAAQLGKLRQPIFKSRLPSL